MQEVKYRVWNGNYKKLKEVFGLDLYGKRIFLNEELSAWWIFEHCKLMQYTGLKDKNGKEIYEGDIVRYPDASIGSSSYDYDCYENVGVVEYDAESLSYYFTERETVEMSEIDIPNEVEVIGNIYETQERLEGEPQ